MDKLVLVKTNSEKNRMQQRGATRMEETHKEKTQRIMEF